MFPACFTKSFSFIRLQWGLWVNYVGHTHPHLEMQRLTSEKCWVKVLSFYYFIFSLSLFYLSSIQRKTSVASGFETKNEDSEYWRRERGQRGEIDNKKIRVRLQKVESSWPVSSDYQGKPLFIDVGHHCCPFLVFKGCLCPLVIPQIMSKSSWIMFLNSMVTRREKQ